MTAISLNRRALLAGLAATTLQAARPAVARAAAPEASLAGWADITLLDAGGQQFRVGDGARPFTLIKLWANWCSACLRELDMLPGLVAGLAPATVETILVSHPQDWTGNQARLAQRGAPAVRCARPSPANTGSAVQSALIAADGTYYVPRSMLFSHAHQAVVWSHVGSIDWSQDRSLAPIRRWIG